MAERRVVQQSGKPIIGPGDLAFSEAYWELWRERNGASIPVSDVEERAKQLIVIPRLPKLVPPPLPNLERK